MNADLIGARARAALAGPPMRLGRRVGARERRSIVNGIDCTPGADLDRLLGQPHRIVSIGAARRADVPPPAKLTLSPIAVARAAPVAVMARAAIARAQRARPRI